MEIIYYESEASIESEDLDYPYPDKRDVFIDTIESQYANFKVYHQFAELIERLKTSMHDILGLVLFIHQELELEKILAHRELLDGLSIFLILPNEKQKSLSSGHLIRPRHMTSVMTDADEIKLILSCFIRAAVDRQKNRSHE